ncbi:MAG: Lrp/AsnC family transcriptional regulator [Candidatus Thorarchaeota archaeon]|nr:MAG: Lrp/AsnC family transcriptional regulator [Candidatus Thorarchaeota archaeon]RLI58313.1 MAG: Lrp/AsnC family transcriptional regulator [Candidatus Thorarchaeota archaeon]
MKGVQAYVLMDIEIGKTDDVVDALRRIDEATMIAVTTGGVDIVVLLEVPTLEDLYKITVQRIHRIEGIRDTQTAVVEQMISV